MQTQLGYVLPPWYLGCHPMTRLSMISSCTPQTPFALAMRYGYYPSIHRCSFRTQGKGLIPSREGRR